jgi:hypothetical protein
MFRLTGNRQTLLSTSRYLSTLNLWASNRQSLHRALGGSRSWQSWRRTDICRRKTGALGSNVVKWLAAEDEAALPLLLTVSERKALGNPGLDGTLQPDIFKSAKAMRIDWR